MREFRTQGGLYCDGTPSLGFKEPRGVTKGWPGHGEVGGCVLFGLLGRRNYFELKVRLEATWVVVFPAVV